MREEAGDWMEEILGQSGRDRRDTILALIKTAGQPLTAASLAHNLGVTRQVIVQDVALLRARNEPILATPRGYVYQGSLTALGVRRVIYCRHSVADTQKELNILVDHGVTVIDVGIEHSVYGRIQRPLGLKSRLDVSKFINQMIETDANLLCSLTGGLHFHTLEGGNDEVLDSASAVLAAAGILADQPG